MSQSQPERLPRGKKPQLYDYDAASFLTGYAPETIRAYCETRNGRAPLQRGIHWQLFSYRYGHLIRRVRLLTAAGIEALNNRRHTAANANHDTNAA